MTPTRGSHGLRRSRATTAVLSALALAFLVPPRAHAQAPGGEATTTATDSLLRAGHSGLPSQWPTYGGDLSQIRFSPLEQIGDENVERLRPAWIHQTGVIGVTETTPVVVGGDMYLTTPMSEDSIQQVIKLDAATGQEIWRTGLYQDLVLPGYVVTGFNRGVAVYEGSVFVGTSDGRIVALDAADGDLLWETATGDPDRGYTQTQAPVAYGGRVYIGASGGFYGARGFVAAYDAATGQEIWRWHTIPAPEDGGWWGDWTDVLPGRPGVSLNRDIAHERADSARFADAWRRGGGNVFMTPTLDPDAGLLYVSIADPAPEIAGPVRPGDNRWTNSVCALHMEDGSREWCYQYLPHDQWNLGAASPPLLLETTLEGANISGVAHASGLGWTYLWDRATGELARLSEAYVPHESFLEPPRPEGTRMAPGFLGTKRWAPDAYNLETGLLYSVNRHHPGRFVSGLPPTVREARRSGEAWRGGRFVPDPEAETYYLVAVDPATGKTAWRHRSERPLVGGLLTTAGGLVFGSRAPGTFEAWSASTGEHLWSYRTGAACHSAAATYRADGRQYVVVACGGRLGGEGPKGDAIIAFTLP